MESSAREFVVIKAEKQKQYDDDDDNSTTKSVSAATKATKATHKYTPFDKQLTSLS
jgi:hypothetical protein